MTDRWTSKVIPCQGGLVLSMDELTLGTQYPGAALQLQNFEPSVSGGYRRIAGYIKYDDDVVPGDTDEPVTGIKVAFDGVFATRYTTTGTDNAIYFGTGSGWTQVNSTPRTGSINKARFIEYSITEPIVIQCDGVNPAWKYDGAADTLLNTAGAPTDPKFAALFRNRLVLGGYGDGSKITFSAPNDDEDYSGASGAIEINVGDIVTGLKTFREELIIFCKNSIRKLTGSTENDFAIVNVTNSIGCTSGDTIQEIAGDLIYVASDTLRSYAATERIGDVNIGSVAENIQPVLSALLLSGFTEDDYSSCCIRRKNQYRLFINDPNYDEQDVLGLLGKIEDTTTVPRGVYEWAIIKGIKPYCADSSYEGNIEIAVFGHPTSGYVYLMESGNTFDGTNIEAIYRSPNLTFDDASIRKVFQKLHTYTQVEGNFTVDVQLILDREDIEILQPTAVTEEQLGSTPLYGVAVYGTDAYGAFVTPNFKTNLIGSGFTGSIQFTCNNDSAPFRIDSYQIEFSVKGRR